jgi:hypothetical protein
MLQLLHMDISKLDQMLYLPHRLSAVSPRCRRGKREQVETIPTIAGGPHVLGVGVAGETWHKTGGSDAVFRTSKR